MPRGRNPSASDVRVLLELLLEPDRAVFGAEIADHLPIGKERVRQILNGLVEDGYVEKSKVTGRNLYRLTDAGYSYLGDELRSRVD